MSTTSVNQTSFAGGEWAPILYGRTDLQKYPISNKTLLNFFVHRHGAASNRGGLGYVGQTKIHSKASRLIPFEFSVVQTYALEFGDQYIRFYKDGGVITEAAKTITAATKANPAVITSAAHGFSNGDYIIIDSVVGMTQLNGKNYKIANVAANTFELQTVDGVDVNSTGYSTYVSGGTASRIYQITTPYLEADLFTIKYEQSADTVYLTHPSYAPRKLTRSSHTSWTLTTITFAPSVAAPTTFASSAGTAHTYAATTVSAVGEESVVSATATGTSASVLTWDVMAGASYYNIYEKINNVYYYLDKAGTNTYTVPTPHPTPDKTISPPTANNPFGSSNNYPGCAAFFDQRLIFARTNNKPQTTFGSVIGSFENMNRSSPVKDDDSFEFTLNARQVNEIRWMVGLNFLIIGTAANEWKMSAGSQSNTITPTSVDTKVQSAWGAANILPIVIGDSLLFVDSSYKAIRDFGYSLERDGFAGNDVTILSYHFFEYDQIVDWCYQKRPHSIIWIVRSDGKLVGLTYVREQELLPWHLHETDGDFESVCSIPNGTTNDVYAIVKRTINSQTRRYVEILKDRMPTGLLKDAFFVDSGLTYDSTPTSTVSGLHHLEGKVVVALADGNVLTDLIVTNGSITFPGGFQASTVQVGLQYDWDLETLPFEYPTRNGTVQDKRRQIKTCVLKLKDSREFKIGPDENNLTEIPLRQDENYDEATNMFNGDKLVILNAGSPRKGSLLIHGTNPVPCTILSIIPSIENGNS